jgi:hydrogenase expression/formation protein HypE
MKPEKILLDHGSGGRAAHNLIAKAMLPKFHNPILAQLNDGAICDMDGKRFAFSTDTYVVDPIFFPGGNIGNLAINGTVNDLAMCGAKPRYLSIGLVIEEGFPMPDLEKILESMGVAQTEAGVEVVTGDTKVVPKGAADKIFINTSGIGLIPEHVDIASHKACSGDKIILSGTIGDHGMTILTRREGLSFDSPLSSDTAPLNHMVENILCSYKDIHVLRDPTRGGLGTALNEISQKSNVGIRIDEGRIPIKDEVAGVCELLGFDPLYVANEGKLIAFVRADHAEGVLAIMKADALGRDASIIGEVVADHPGNVVMKTPIGGTRIVDMLTGEQFPRIC